MKTQAIWDGSSMGCRIFDIDLRHAQELEIQEISELVHRHKVVSIPGQSLTPEQYLAFGRRLGQLVPFKLKNYSTAEHPEIMVLDNQAHQSGIGGRKIGNLWHSDSTYLERPLDLTLLLGREIPPACCGGQTLFIDTQETLQQLPPALLERLGQFCARHEVLWTYKVTATDVGESLRELIDRLRSQHRPAIHPCLWTHPKTGLRSLGINPGYTTGIESLSFDESQALLDEIFSVALRPQNIRSYEWTQDDLLIWDNRSVWHMATPVDENAERRMHRLGVRE